MHFHCSRNAGIVLSHPSRKDKDAARVGHPACPGFSDSSQSVIHECFIRSARRFFGGGLVPRWLTTRQLTWAITG